ncbi:MAG TPA: hypothetical protein VLI90_03035 [Tepidisphaeraceae bacterium]|nr:hypothetical protein [Tepidisphaeraceae bacterium]
MLRSLAGGSPLPNVLLLIDTLADVTLLPASAVKQLGIAPIAGAAYDLIGFDGSTSSATAVELDMIFLGRAYRGRYLLIDDEHGVLGREVLANVAMLFDGPGQEWTEQRTGTKPS